MKRFFWLLCFVLVLTLSVVPAFAAVDDPDVIPDSESEVLEEPSGEDIPTEEEPVAADPDAGSDVETVENPEEDVESDAVEDTSSGDVVDEEAGASVVSIDSSAVVVKDIVDRTDVERTSLTDAIHALFGEYTPRTYTVTTYLDDGTAIQSTEIVPGLAGLDYDWIAGVSVFVLALYCIFRMIGGMFRWK